MKRLVAVLFILLAGIGEAHAKHHLEGPTLGSSWNSHTSSIQHRSFMDGVQRNVPRSHKGKPRHRLQHRPDRRATTSVPGGLVTVQTAANIPITVARRLADQFRGLIQDLVADGYTPKHIGCWAPVGTHVPNSNHYHGGACDFDQTGWGKTAPKMYHVRDLVAKWGLRDGCTFRRPDCGHIDDGTNIGWRFQHPNLIAKYIDWTMKPADKPKTVIDLAPFEE